MDNNILNKRLRLFSTLRDAVGLKEVTIPFENSQTVRDMLHTIGGINPVLRQEILGEDGELTGLVHILVDGRNIMWLQGLDTVVEQSAEVVLLPPSAGG